MSAVSHNGKVVLSGGKALSFDSLIAEANAVTGADDKTLSAAVGTLIDGYGGGSSLGYNVTFMNGTEAYQTVSCRQGDTVAAPYSPFRTGVAFDRWEDADGNAVAFPFTPDGDTSLYSVFTENYTVSSAGITNAKASLSKTLTFSGHSIGDLLMVSVHHKSQLTSIQTGWETIASHADADGRFTLTVLKRIAAAASEPFVVKQKDSSKMIQLAGIRFSHPMRLTSEGFLSVPSINSSTVEFSKPPGAYLFVVGHYYHGTSKGHGVVNPDGKTSIYPPYPGTTADADDHYFVQTIFSKTDRGSIVMNGWTAISSQQNFLVVKIKVD